MESANTILLAVYVYTSTLCVPVHPWPLDFSLYPLLQEQLYDPALLVHV